MIGPVASPELPEEVERERNLYRHLLELGFHDKLEPLLQESLGLLIAATGARRVAIKIWQGSDASAEPSFALERGFDGAEDLSAFSHAVIDETFATGETIATASASTDLRFSERKSVRAKGLEAVLCVPLGRSPVAGVLYLQDRQELGPFSPAERQRAETFARHLGTFVERLLLRHRSGLEEDHTRELRRTLKADSLVGKSQAMAALLRQAALVAPFKVSVLVTGPSGSGKTQLARVIHANGSTPTGPFVELNCGAIPSDLIESELFGAFPGAHATANKRIYGKVAAAEGGTLFLDEVGELPWRAQAALLQLLQNKTYFPLGSSTALKACVRVLAATNTDLQLAIAERRFREDLYYRLNVFPIRLPALAERRSDLPLLAVHFCERACETNGLPHLELAPGALRAIEAADWPGEVRALCHAVEAAVIRAHGEGSAAVERQHLFPETSGEEPAGSGGQQSFRAATRRFQEELVRQALDSASGNVSAAARSLGLTRAHLYNLMATFGTKRD